MMKTIKKLLAVLSCAALLLVSVCAIGISAASAATTQFLEPFDNSSFPLAAKVNTILPDNYDVTYDKVMQNGGVFGLVPDAKASAAFMMCSKAVKLFRGVYGDSYVRGANLMKNYVACELELIYYFENGFKDFEFMGICGASGNWAGAWGKEDAVEFAYSNSADGGWSTFDYNTIRDMPAGQDSTYCLFGSSDIPTSARYLRIRFTNGANYNAAKNSWEPTYENWSCVLGYLKVDKYNEAQSAGTTGGSTSSTTSKNPSSGTASGTGSSSGSASSEETASTSDTSSVTDDKDTAGLTDEELIDKIADGDKDYYVVTSREIDWKITGIIIAADVVAVGGVIAVLIVLYRKKLKKLGLTAHDTSAK